MSSGLPSRKGYRRLVESLRVIVWRAEPASLRFTFVSGEAEELLGYPMGQWTEATGFWAEHIHPEDRGAALSSMRWAADTRSNHTFEYRMVARDGRVVWLRTIATALLEGGELQELVGIMADITERKRLEEERARLFDLSLDLLAIFGFDGRLRQVNRAFGRVLGWSEEELLSRPYVELVHARDRKRLVAEMRRLKAGFETTDFELRLRCKDGTYRWLRASAKPVPEDRLCYSVATDITDRKAAEQALRDSEERYRELVEHAPEAVVVFDVDAGRLVMVNAGAERLFGRTREQLLEMDLPQLSPLRQPDGRRSAPMIDEALQLALKGETPKYEWVHRSATGEQILCEVHLHRLPAANRRMIRGSILDIRERKRAEDARRLYEEQRSIAETLQRSLLPGAPPHLDGATIAVRYVPGSPEVDVGGDWYDVLPLGDDDVWLVVGDVTGRGIHAATAMGQLRNALRAYALEGHSPARSLTLMNRLVLELEAGECTTVVCAHLELPTRLLRIAVAGHPPPLILAPDGTTAYLDGGRLLPLGVLPDVEYVEARHVLQPDSTLLLYTDGLVETRDRSLLAGLERLLAVASGTRHGHELLDHLLAQLVGDRHEDDVALLALTTGAAEMVAVEDGSRRSTTGRATPGAITTEAMTTGAMTPEAMTPKAMTRNTRLLLVHPFVLPDERASTTTEGRGR